MLTHEVFVEVDDDPVPVVNDPEPADPIIDDPVAGNEPTVISDTNEQNPTSRRRLETKSEKVGFIGI